MPDARITAVPVVFHLNNWSSKHGGKTERATDLWLYIFKVSRREVHLCEEIYADKSGNYHSVDLDRCRGQETRPFGDGIRDTVWLETTEKRHRALESIPYYVLCSPFQLRWSRLKALDQQHEPAAFEKLAKEQRGVSPVLLDDKNTTIGPGGTIRIKGLWSPWHEAECYSLTFRGFLNQWQNKADTEERRQQRSLLAIIDTLGKGRDVKGLLDQDELARVHKLLLDDDKLFEATEEAAAKLVACLKGPAMLAMEKDAAATDDADTRDRFAAIRVGLEVSLSQTRAGRKYREEWFAENHHLVLFDAAGAFKVTRKVTKAIFYWAKSWADVAAGYRTGPLKGQVPRMYLNWVAKQAQQFTGLFLFTDSEWRDIQEEKRARKVLTASEFEEWERRRYTLDELLGRKKPAWAHKLEGLEPLPEKFRRDSLDQLKAKVNANPALNGLFLLVDAASAVFALWSLFAEESKSEEEKKKKAYAAASSLFSFISSGLGFSASVTIHMTEDEVATLQALAQENRISHLDNLRLVGFQNQGSVTRLLARAGATRVVGLAVGGLGAVAESVSNLYAVDEGLREARVGDSPDRIWLWPGLGFMGSATMAIGYLALGMNPAGALLVAAGAIIMAVSTAGTVFWPGLVRSDVDKWLMHSFVGKLRLRPIDEDASFTEGKVLAAYHQDLALQLKVLDNVLFDFRISGDFTQSNDGRPILRIDVAFRQLKTYSKVRMAVLASIDGEWKCVRNETDWRGPGCPPELGRPGQGRMEGAFRIVDAAIAADHPEMRIAVQIDVVGDGSFLYPPEPRTKDIKR